ncbi:MAG: hypoxanthine phosphoribosyltransferase [Sphingobacteriaceae bacterium]
MKIKVGDLAFEPMLNYSEIEDRISEIGQEINRDYVHTTPLFIGVLSGSFMFLADLMKTVSIPAEITFVKLASYEGDKRTGQIALQLGLTVSISGRDIVVVEDIVDSGHTLSYLLKMLQHENAKSITICSLLYKPEACQHKFKALKYVGFEIPNDFVVGYGLDYNGLGRNLKDIYRLAGN